MVLHAAHVLVVEVDADLELAEFGQQLGLHQDRDLHQVALERGERGAAQLGALALEQRAVHVHLPAGQLALLDRVVRWRARRRAQEGERDGRRELARAPHSSRPRALVWGAVRASTAMAVP